MEGGEGGEEEEEEEMERGGEKQKEENMEGTFGFSTSGVSGVISHLLLKHRSVPVQ